MFTLASAALTPAAVVVFLVPAEVAAAVDAFLVPAEVAAAVDAFLVPAVVAVESAGFRRLAAADVGLLDVPLDGTAAGVLGA